MRVLTVRPPLSNPLSQTIKQLIEMSIDHFLIISQSLWILVANLLTITANFIYVITLRIFIQR